MKQGNDGMRAGDWPAAIGAYGLAMLQQPALGRHYVANLQRAARRYRQERLRRHGQPPSPPTVVVAAAELSHNSAGRAYLLAQLHQQLGSPVTLLGSHFLPFGRDLWEPIRQTSLPIASFVVEDESRFVYQAAQLVLSHPADLVHLST